MRAFARKFIDLCETPEFVAAWREINERSVLWEEFKLFSTPEGISSEQLWEVMTALRYHAGIVLPFKPYVSHMTGQVWFSTPKNMQVQLQQLSRDSHQSGPLWQYIVSSKNKNFHLYLYLQEISSVLRRDGANLDDERIKAVWLGLDKPSSPNEQVLINLRTMLFNASQYLHRKATRGLIEELYENLVGNEDFSACGTKRLSARYQTERWDSDYTLDVLCALASDDVSNVLVHPMLASINISGILWDHRPLPAFNATLDLVIKKIFYTRLNHPVLAYLPFSSISERWESGKIKPSTGNSFTKVLRGNSKYGYDSTPFHAAILDLYIKELEMLSAKVALFKAKETEYQEKIERISFLNHRQKQALATMLLSPGSQLTIASYQKSHKVSYATARKDLLQLVEKGYLWFESEGGSFQFTETSNCLSLINTAQE